MEKFLLKLAKQLDEIDEASLIQLWDKYAAIVNRFEPSKRWEEAVLVFSLIQAKRWKNQLFNHYWSEQLKPGSTSMAASTSAFSLEVPEAQKKKKEAKRATVLEFKFPE